jgi:chromosomal replication initiation ATPase DnaA
MSVILEQAIRRAKYTDHPPATEFGLLNLLKARIEKLEYIVEKLQADLDRKANKQKPFGKELSPLYTSAEPTIKEVAQEVCDTYCVSFDKVMSDSQQKRVTEPRQIAIYLSNRLIDKPMTVICREFKRDHTTGVHAVRKVRRLRDADARFDLQLEKLEERIMASRPSSDQPCAMEALATDYTLGESHEPLAPSESDGRETT